MATKREVLRELSWRKCAGTGPRDLDALIFWLETYVKIQHPDPEKGSIPFLLRPAQREILETWTIERNSIVLKARQIGWSTLVACYALWLVLFYADVSVIMLSKGEREAEKLLAKATYAYDRMPAWMRERGPKRIARNLKKIGFANGSSIESMPSKEDPARSSSASLVVVDEWAFLENPEDAWASIEPVADVGGRIIGLSTANGSGDFFHQFWIKAVTGVTDFKPMFYPWSANDDRDNDWYERQKRTKLPWQLHQEYPSTPEEAFVKSGNPVFDVDALALMEIMDPLCGYLDVLEHGLRVPSFVPMLEGEFKLWAEPRSSDSYVIGADVAEGLEHGDFSAAYVLSVKDFRTVAAYHGHMDTDDFAEVLAAMGWYYGTALIGVEANNHGLSTNNHLNRVNYPKLYYRRALDQRTKEPRDTRGWLTTAATKPLMIDELARALKQGMRVDDEFAIGELRTYKRDEKGRMGGSPYDDRVMALAVAVQMLEHVRAPEFQEVVDDYGTWNYFVGKLINSKKNSTEQKPMGFFNRRPRRAA